MSLDDIAAVDKTITLADRKEYTLGQFSPNDYCKFRDWVAGRMRASLKAKAKDFLAAAVESGIDAKEALAMSRDMILGREDLADVQQQASALVKAMMEIPSVEKMKSGEKSKYHGVVLEAAKGLIQGRTETAALGREANAVMGAIEGVQWVLWNSLKKHHGEEEISYEAAGDLMAFGEEHYIEVLFACGVGEDPKKKETPTPEKVEEAAPATAE